MEIPPLQHGFHKALRFGGIILLVPALLVIISMLNPLQAGASPQGQASGSHESLAQPANYAPANFSGRLLLQARDNGITPQVLDVLHSFNGPDGAGPNSLLEGSDGLLYGSAGNGGDTNACAPDGCGVLFTLDPASGGFAVLHTFHATDGYIPTGLIQGTDGNYYGTTMSGGQPSGGGAGTFFRIDAAGNLTTLYAFVGGFACCDGGAPVGHPIQASDGNFYGLTFAGGEFRDVDHPGGFGTFYQYDPGANTLTILHSFNIADANGIFPSGSLVQGTDGFFYGVTSEGGAGGGTIYRLDMAGDITLLHAITDSAEPLDGLVQASDGSFYGTTDGGAGAGTVYRIDAAGNYSVVNKFDGGDGYKPHYGLMFSDGLFYGTTPKGGLLDFQGGSLFRLDSSGKLDVLHSFAQTHPLSGIVPNSVLIQASDGMIYGAAGIGGSGLHGTIFRIDPGLPGPIASVAVDPQVIVTPGEATVTISLSSPAPQGGLVVDLRVTSFNVVIPMSITIPAGMTSGTFTLQASQVIQTEEDRLYASVEGEGTRGTFSLLPPGTTPTPTLVPSPTPTATEQPPTATPTPTPTDTSVISPTPTATGTPMPVGLLQFFLPFTGK